jgi:CBS domain containing-hemolysin-like protein
MWSPAIIGLLLLLLAGSALIGYSFREFSFSRLEDVCDRNGRPERFHAILDDQEAAQLVFEFCHTVLIIAAAAAIWWRIGLHALPINPDSLAFWILALKFAGMMLITLLAADLAPWVASRVASERVLYNFWPLIQLVRRAGLPVVATADLLDRWTHRLAGRGTPDANDAEELGDEIRSVVEEGEREGVIESDAGEMIQSVMELQNEDVAAIMTPRTEMICVNVESTLDEARRAFIESGHSRVPVIGESTDDILGLLYAKDLLKALPAQRTPGDGVPVLRDLLREPIHAPVTTQIPALLELMKRTKVHLAIVLDEYGGVAGLVTMEDILEEIVGEISDEYDKPEEAEDVRIVSPTVAEVDGRVHLDELNERFDYGLPEDGEFDTIGGFVFSQLGRVPSVGETVSWKQLKFTVLAADRRKITRLQIEVEPEHAATAAISEREE